VLLAEELALEVGGALLTLSTLDAVVRDPAAPAPARLLLAGFRPRLVARSPGCSAMPLTRSACWTCRRSSAWWSGGHL
jgi:hypothetical protein